MGPFERERLASGPDIKKCLLRAQTAGEEWMLLKLESMLTPPDGYIVSFITFHEGGFIMPAHRFLCGLLTLVGNLTNMTIHFCRSRPSKHH